MSDYSEDIELMESFVTESTDLLDDIEPLFIDLKKESGPTITQKETINRIFRVFHSIKGSAGFLRLENIAEVTHHAETLLDAFRIKDLSMTSFYLDVLLRTVDVLRQMQSSVIKDFHDKGYEDLKQETSELLLEAIKKTKNQEEFDLLEIEEIKKINQSDIKVNETNTELIQIKEDICLELEITPEMAVRFSQEAVETIDNAEQSLLKISKEEDKENKKEFIKEAFRYIHSFKGNCGFMQLADFESLSHTLENVLDAIRNDQAEATEQTIDILLQTIDVLREGLKEFNQHGTQEIDNCDLMKQFLVELVAEPALLIESKKENHETSRITTSSNTQKPRREATDTKAPQDQNNNKITRRDIRVDVNKLDALINLVGELVIAESMVMRNQLITNIEDEYLERSIHHLQRVSSELQDVAMSVRMIPLASTFKKMIRLVHDLSRKSEKKAEIQIIGEETEVDKNVIEAIGDPIIHIIRNSVDHGIEPASERLANGKKESGTITLEAKHEGGEVWITIKDDGKGLNRERILKKAQENSLIDGDGSEMSDEEAFNLIFEPGFSTAEKITDISGRGVGMDVVKKNIDNLNGRISVKSVAGEGTTMTLHIPLTLAIIEGMLIRVGSNQYTIPLLSIRESIRIAKNRIVKTPDGSECVKVRNEIVPILRLHKMFNKNTEIAKIENGILVIVESDSKVAAIFVDEIIGQQEVVIKGLDSYLGNIKGISGCTVLGDGEVSLIIDVGMLLKSAISKQ
jgi:two-component system chemotaxis sensor kinase CheA